MYVRNPENQCQCKQYESGVTFMDPSTDQIDPGTLLVSLNADQWWLAVNWGGSASCGRIPVSRLYALRCTPSSMTLPAWEPLAGSARCVKESPNYPVWGCVGVELSASKRSKPSGIDSLPTEVPGVSVRPYCHTIELVVGSITMMRSR